MKLSSDNGTLDLAQSTLEQQKIEKAKAARKLLAARENRIIINPDELMDIETNYKVNIALYARKTENVLGKI